MQEKLKK